MTASTCRQCRSFAQVRRCSRPCSSGITRLPLQSATSPSPRSWTQRRQLQAVRGHPTCGLSHPAGVLCSAAPVAERPLQTPVSTEDLDGAAHYNGLDASEVVVRAALDLRTRGWAVVPDVFTRAECEEYVDSVWGWLESLGTGIKRNDASTWTDERWPPNFKNAGIINRLEVAHQDFVWKLRADERLTNVFAALWGTDALLSSFDSVNIMRPPAVATPGRDLRSEPPPSWWHTDQAPRKAGLECIQGLLNLSDVGPHAGTLQVREGSHAAHEHYWRDASAMPHDEKQACGDFYVFKPEEYDYWDQFPTKVLRGYSPGSLFLWDSRTVHQNCPPSDPTIWRHVLYTCYQPAAMATEMDLAVKRRAYETYDITTHWPSINVSVGAPPTEEEQQKFVLPRTRDRVENDTILQLAGMKAYDAATERRCKPLIDTPVHELEAMLAGHELRKAEALAAWAEQLAAAAQRKRATASAAA